MVAYITTHTITLIFFSGNTESATQNRNTQVYQSISEAQIYEIPKLSNNAQSKKNVEHTYHVLEATPQQKLTLEQDKERAKPILPVSQKKEEEHTYHVLESQENLKNNPNSKQQSFQPKPPTALKVFKINIPSDFEKFTAICLYCLIS